MSSPIDPKEDRRIAAALAGDGQAVAEVLPGFDPGRRGARLAVLLAHQAARTEPPLPAPEPLRALRKRVAATWVMVERDLSDLGRALGGANVEWAPFRAPTWPGASTPTPACGP